MTSFADSQVVDRDLWGSLRLFMGGQEVSYFRDVPTQIVSYQLTEPYSFGPAEFKFPQLTAFEVDAFGTGALRWAANGKPARLKQVDADGDLVRTVWRGLVTSIEVTSTGVVFHCDGEASGRLALRDKQPEKFYLKRHVGRRLFDAFNACRLTLSPALGNDIGVLTDARGMTGGRFLDYTDSLLAATIDTDGSQYTIRYRETQNDYHLETKDTDTVDFTVFVGAHGVELDLFDDMSEKPNAIYGSGTDPDGLIWDNARYPGLIQGVAPDYPMDDNSSFGSGTEDADTDSGDGVSRLIHKLVGMGYLPRTKVPGGYDSDVVAAIKDLQDDAGLSETGTTNVATWKALWDLEATGFSLLGAFIAPLAQASLVRRWNRSSNGTPLTPNPGFDPSVVPVDLTIDHATAEKSRAKHYSRGVMHRAQNGSNWAGTLTLTSDVFEGDVVFADVKTPMSRFDITAGMNVKLRHFDSGTKFHVSVVNIAGDGTVVLGIDTKNRDAASLAEVIARNIESRSHPARIWRRLHRANANLRHVEASEVFGLVFNTIDCAADSWTVFPILAGQAGSVARVRVQTTGDPAAFTFALFAQKVSGAYLRHHIGNPFDSNADGESKWTNPSVQAWLDNQRAILGAWGDEAQPCGYAPRSHTGNNGETTDATITGLFREDGGFDYHTFGQPVIWAAIYVDRDTQIKPQRVLWDVIESDA